VIVDHRKVHKQCCPCKVPLAYVQMAGLLSLSASQHANPATVCTFTLQQFLDVLARR